MTEQRTGKRRVSQWLTGFMVGIGLLVLILLLAIRLALPQLTRFHAEIEAEISQHLRLPVRLEQLTIAWQGWEPILRVQGFSLRDPTHDLPLAQFDQAIIHLQPFRSLQERRPALRTIRLQGGYLRLAYDTSGQLSLVPRSVRGPSPPLQDMLAWLFSIDSLDMQLDELQLPAFKGDQPWVFKNLRLSLRHQDLHRLGVTVDLPETLGQQLHLIAALPENDSDPAAWQGHFYARGMDLRPTDWPLPINFSAGLIDDFELWGEWQGLNPTRMQGHARSRELALTTPSSEDQPALIAPDTAQLSTRFEWHRVPDGWSLQSVWRGLDKTEKPLVESDLNLLWKNPQADVPGRLEGHGSDVRLTDLLAIIRSQLNVEQQRWLAQLAPTGLLPELTWWAESNSASATPNYGVAAEFQQLSTQAWQTVPGVENLSGKLSFDSKRKRGNLTLASQDLAINLRQWQAPLTLNGLTGAITWQQHDHGLDLETSAIAFNNAFIDGLLKGTITLPAHSKPVVDVQLDYDIADIGQLSAYVPADSMHPKLEAWLKRAPVSGQLSGGQTKLQGRLADFPFTRNTGLFETRFQLHNAIVDYSPKWPRLEELEAEVNVRNESFGIKAVSGKLLAADLEYAEGRISNLRKAVVEIDGRVRASSTAMLQFLQDSPLAERVGPHISALQASGENIVDLQLTVPLDKRPARAQGTVGFTGGNVSIPEYGLVLNQVEGDLGFNNEGLHARDIQVEFRGESARLDVATQSTSQGKATNFTLSGRWDLPSLLDLETQSFESYLQGKIPLDIELQVPLRKKRKPPAVELAASSDLQGVTINLPPPLGKTSSVKRQLNIKTQLNDDQRIQLSLDYAPDIQAKLQWTGFPQQTRFSRGALHINAGQAQLPEAPGMVLVANLPSWQLNLGGVGGATPLVGFSRAMVHIDKLRLGDWLLPDLSVEAVREEDRLRVDLAGTAANGQLLIPTQAGAALQVDLQQLKLNRSTAAETPEESVSDPDPRRLPPLDIKIQDLSVENRPLGSIQVLTKPQADGLRLVDLYLRSDDHELTASGDWVRTANGPLSRLQAGFNSQDLGASLLAFGYANDLQGGETSAELTASWRAPLLAVKPELLNGHLDFTIGSGQLLNLEPGVGRVFGLLNLNNIMRRLRLDFTDLFQEGMSFDRIAGSFDFKQGQAYTDDFVLEGPAAHIGITGRVDLEERYYNQLITVTPQVGTPLTIAGTIAGGPAVGAAVFLAERLLKPSIDQVTRYQYRLTGSWENPSIRALDGNDEKRPSLIEPVGEGNQ